MWSQIACDVTNPLYSQGATYIYGPQKGVTLISFRFWMQGMKIMQRLLPKWIGKITRMQQAQVRQVWTWICISELSDGELTLGIQLILDAVHVGDEMKDADVVVTGRSSDHQTAMGKPWLER